MGQFMRLARSQDKGHRASEPISDHTSLGPIAPTRAAQRLTARPAPLKCPFLSGPGRFLMGSPQAQRPGDLTANGATV